MNSRECASGEGPASSSFKCTLTLNFEHHRSWSVAAEFPVRKVNPDASLAVCPILGVCTQVFAVIM